MIYVCVLNLFLVTLMMVKTMKAQRKYLVVTSILAIFVITSFCALFSKQEETTQTDNAGGTGAVISTPSPAPTLIPTNLVKVDDSGSPLPPEIMMVVPSGGQEIGTNGVIQIQFNQPMDANTTASAFRLLDQQGQETPGEITWPVSDTLYFKPVKPLIAGGSYHLILEQSATSAQKIQLADDIQIDIEVADDLFVSQVFPADGTVDVESNAVITIIFNRPVVPLVSLEDQGGMAQPLRISPPIQGSGEWINTSVYIFHPEEALASSTMYELEVEKGLSDIIGSRLQETYQWQFTTAAPGISTFGISSPVYVTNPEDNYKGVFLESAFEIVFLQPMNRASVEEAFSITTQGGEGVVVNFDWPSDYQVIITPTQRLSLETDYTMILTRNAKANTGGELMSGLRWDFRTLAYPGILSTVPENGSTASQFSNRFRINFNSPIQIDAIEDHIVITPPVDEKLTWYYDSWSWGLDFFGLKPSTRYRITILPGLEDIYGNKITDPYDFSFTTGPYSPAVFLDLPYPPSVYRQNGPMKYYISYVNVGPVSADLYQIPASYFAGFTNGTYQQWDFVPPEDWWINSWYWENNKFDNEVVRRGVPLEKASGESLEPGFYFLTIDSPDVTKYSAYVDSRLLIVAEANLTFKSTLTEGLVWLTDLDSGAPIQNVSVMFYDHDFNEIGSGATNSNGLLMLDLPAPEEVYESRYVMTNEGQPFAFSYSDWGSGVSPYEFGIWSDYYSLPDQPIAYVYTDRPLYRPGQTVEFKGILRGNDDLSYRLLPWEAVTVEISSFNEVVFTQKLSLSDYGSFNGSLILDDNAALGYYSIIVKPPDGEDGIGGVGFSVGEYRKPEFQVSSIARKSDIVIGDNFTIDITADYYSGGNVGEAHVDWGLMATDFYFSPGGVYGNYSFVDYDRDSGLYFDEAQFYQSKVIAEGEAKTDQDGRLELSLVADLVDSDRSQVLTFEATVSDLAGSSVSDRTEIVAHQAAYYVGVRSQHYVGVAGEEQGFDLVLLDWNGEPVPGGKINAEIVERHWYSVQEQDPQGFVQWKTSVEEIPVIDFKDVVVDSRGRASVKFVPENGGVYKAKVSTQDDDGNIARSGASIWISSDDYVAWRQTDDRGINLVPDKEEYQPGEIAEILIASPFMGENFALITVERGHIREQDVVRMTNNSVIYQLPITKEMAPNVYLSVLIIQGADNDRKPDFRMGMIQLNVAAEKQKINVEIVPNNDQAGPGDEVLYKIKTTDSNGNPVRAEVSVALADLSALSLTQPNSQPILDYFYGKRSLSVRTAVPIVLSIEHYISTLEDRLTAGEGMGSGGGKGTDVYGVFDIRGDFRDTAFWQADVITDENGEATIKVVLPDNLTTWRMDARAVTVDTLVGDGENDIKSSKPLLVRPQTPRFFVVGDRVTLGTAVQNNTDQDLTVRVILDGTGIEIKSDVDQQVEIPAGRQAYVTWDVSVKLDAERVDLVFMASGGQYSDASKPPLGSLDDQGIPVYRYEVPESVGTSGVLSEPGSLTEGISIPSQWGITEGDLTVRISPSLAAGLVDGLDYLEHYPYECIEQTISRFLPNILTTRAMASAGISDPELETRLDEQVNLALQRLYNWQHPDGGWGWWPNTEESDSLTTGYVVFGLAEVDAAGYQVSADVLSRGISYLKGTLQSLGSLDQQYKLNRQTFLLYVLARVGEPQVSLTGSMYESRQSLSLYARAYLAEALWRIDPLDKRIDSLISDFVNAAIISATGVHWQEDWRDFMNWNSDTRTTAIILSTLLQVEPENRLNVDAVRWLMTNRTKGHWRTTQETSWSLITLSRWLEYTQELTGDYDWAVGLNQNRIGDGSVTPESLRQDILLMTPVSDLLGDEINRLTIARDDGPGSLYYTAHLNVFLPADQVEPVDQGIIVSREYFDPMLEGRKPVTQATQGTLLLARLTIITPNDLHYLVIDDPLPAGLEAVDQSLEISPDITAPQHYDFDSLWQQGWGWWYFDHVEFRDEKVLVSADYLPAGTYIYTYIVRASTPGVFSSIPPTAQEFYFPEVYGRGTGGSFSVVP